MSVYEIVGCWSCPYCMRGAVLCAPVMEGLIRDPKECATHLALEVPNLTAQITPFSWCVFGEGIHACIHVHVCACAWEGHRSMLDVFLYHSPAGFLKQGVSLNLELTDSTSKP